MFVWPGSRGWGPGYPEELTTTRFAIVQCLLHAILVLLLLSLDMVVYYFLGTNGPALPYVLVGDEAFPLRTYLLRPYPGRNLEEQKAIFNYRLSRARRIVDNSFGILAARFVLVPLYFVNDWCSNWVFRFFSRWRLFRRPIIAEPDNVVKFTKATIVLHNFLRTEESALYCPPGFVDGEDGSGNVIPGSWRDGEDTSGLSRVGRISSNRLFNTPRS